MKRFLSGALSVLMILSTSCSYFNSTDEGNGGNNIAAAEYPEMMQYPADNPEDFEGYEAWRESRAELLAYSDQVSDNYVDFAVNTVRGIVQAEAGQNVVYSPMSLYMALAMLTETTDGTSRQELLDLLQSDSVESLREEAQALFLSSYLDDGMSMTLLANSLWTNDLASESLNYKDETLDLLADQYYADVFSGEMGNSEYNKVLQDWLNEKTGDFLEDTVSEEGFNGDTVLSLVSTVYYKAAWLNSFYDSFNSNDSFHGVNNEVEVEFMHKDHYSTQYLRGDNFGAIEEYMAGDAGSMLFILPDEGSSPEDVMNSDSFSEMLNSSNGFSINLVNFGLPKFDVQTDLELNDHLKSLGLDEIFSPMYADFSNLAENSDALFLSQVFQASRVMVDEDGVTAASYTKLDVDATSAPIEDEPIDFVLDRPFIFVILTATGNPMFVGVVNQL